jgi:hypothetical protein
MEDKTAQSHVDNEPHYYEEGEANTVAAGKGATTEDARDMMRMGKTQVSILFLKHSTNKRCAVSQSLRIYTQ